MTSMIAWAATALSLSLTGPQAPAAVAWTWALYDGDGHMVFAEEVPDTTRLRNTFECDPGAGVARLTAYGFGAASGYARFSAGEASGTAQVADADDGDLVLSLPVDHPAIAGFAANGRLTVAVGEVERRIDVPRPRLADLRRFVQSCAR